MVVLFLFFFKRNVINMLIWVHKYVPYELLNVGTS